jgi:hypothetical protein
MNTNMTGSSTMPEDHDITLTGGVLPHDPHLYDQHRSYEDFGEFLLGLGRLIKSGTLPDMEDTEEGENNDLHKAVKKPAPSTITDVFGGTHTVRNVTVMPKRDNAPEGDHYFRVSTKQGSDPAKAHHIHQYPANKYRPAHTYCMTCGGDYCAGMKGLQQAESSGNLHKGIGIHGTAASFMPKIFDQGLRSSKQTGIKNFGKNGDATDLTAKKNGAYMANPTHNAAQAISIAHSAAAKRKSDPMVLLSHVNHHEAHPDEDYTEIFTDQMHAMTPDNPHSATSIRQAARGKVGSFQHQSAGLQRVVDKMPDADLVAAHAHAKAGHAQGKTWAETEKHIDEHHAGMEKYFKGEHSMEYGAAAFPGNRPHTIAGAVSWKHIPREKYAAQDARTKPIHDILQQHGHDPHTAFQHLAALPGVTVHHNPNYNPAAAQAMEKSAVRPKTYYTGTCHADLQDAANGVHKCLPPVAFVFRCAKGTLSKAVRDVSREARDTAGKWTKEPWQMTRAEVVGTNPQTDPLASHWNEEAFLQSDLKPVKIGPVIHRYDYPPKTKVYGDTRGYEFSVADNARQKGQTLLMARHIDANGLPLENGLGQFSPVGEYYHGNTGILQAYRGKGAGVAFTKANMESRRRKHPSIGYSPSGLKTVLQAHKQIITTALSQGKSVPDKVLQDYPEIKKPINKAVRDVSREARIPKGQKGGGEFAPSESTGTDSELSHLMAVHNTTGEGILAASDIGGIPAPSIAIFKPHHGFGSFGDISLVGNKKLIDPENDHRNKLFESDVYSPRQPLISHDLDMKESRKFEMAIDKIVGSTDYGHGGGFDIRRFTTHTEGGKQRLLEDMSGDPTIKAAFLKAHGVDVHPVTKAMNTTTPLLDSQATRDFLATAPVLSRDGFSGEMRKKLTDLLLASVRENGIKAGLDEQDIEGLTKRHLSDDGMINLPRYDGMINDLRNLRNGSSQVDPVATRQMLNKHMDAQPKNALMQWLRENTMRMWQPGYLKAAGRKEAYTIENLVKTMTGKGTRAQEGGASGSLGAARAVGTKGFKTVEDMKKRHESLVSEGDMKAHKEQTEKEFHDFQNQMLGLHRSANEDSYNGGTWSALDDSTNAIGLYLKGAKTVQGMERALHRCGFHGPFNEDTVRLGMDVAKRLHESPTEYFEAKLNRPVNLSEFSGAVVPHDTEAGVLEALHRAGVHDIRHYPHGDREARKKHLVDMAQHPDVMIKSIWGLLGSKGVSPFDTLSKGVSLWPAE